MVNERKYLHIQSGTSNPKVYYDLTREEMSEVLEEWRKEYLITHITEEEYGVFVDAVPKHKIM